jgi:hypothetical protein
VDLDGMARLAPREAENGLADVAGPLAPLGSPGDGLGTKGWLLARQLGVVDDRREDVVELVGDHGRHRPQRRQALEIAELIAQQRDLLLELADVFLVCHETVRELKLVPQGRPGRLEAGQVLLVRLDSAALRCRQDGRPLAKRRVHSYVVVDRQPVFRLDIGRRGRELEAVATAMEPHIQLRVLLDLAEEVGIVIRRVPTAGDGAEHPGGALVRLKGREILFLDPTATVGDQVAVVSGALRGRQAIEDRYLPPEIRQLIDGQDGE